MEIDTIVQELLSSIKYYEGLPCVTVTSSDLYNAVEILKKTKLIKNDTFNILNPLKKIMVDSNLTDDFKHSYLGITISKSYNKFEITAPSMKYILFISNI